MDHKRKFPHNPSSLQEKAKIPFRMATILHIEDNKAYLEIARDNQTYIFFFTTNQKKEVLSRLDSMVESQSEEYKAFDEFDFAVIKRDIEKYIPYS